MEKLTRFTDRLDVRGKMKSRIISGFLVCAMGRMILPFIEIEETEKNMFEGRN